MSTAATFAWFNFNKFNFHVIFSLACVTFNAVQFFQVSSSCFPLVASVAFVVFTLACVTRLRITKLSSRTLLCIIWNYISLKYVLDTFLQLSTPFGHNRHFCHNLCCKFHNVSFHLSHLEISVTLLSFRGVIIMNESYVSSCLVLIVVCVWSMFKSCSNAFPSFTLLVSHLAILEPFLVLQPRASYE